MRIFERTEYRMTGKSPAPPENLERVMRLLGEKGYGGFKLRFFLMDRVSFPNPYRKGGQVSATRRVLRKFPELHEFEGLHQDANFGPCAFLSNLDATWPAERRSDSDASIDPEILLTLARGVPRSYPFSYASYFLDDIPWADQRTLSYPAVAASGRRREVFPTISQPANCVAIHHGWGHRHRNNDLAAFVELAQPQSEGQRVSVPDGLRDFLTGFGNVRSITADAYRDVGEEKEMARRDEAASQVLDDWKQKMRHISALVEFPHELPPSSTTFGREEKVEFRKVFASRFRRLGYRHAGWMGGTGLFCYVKRTETNHFLVVHCDLGGWSGAVSCSLAVRGPTWHQWLDLAVCGGLADDVHQYRPSTAEQVEKLADNLAVLLPHLEGSFVEELAATYGSAPAWFEYDRPKAR